MCVRRAGIWQALSRFKSCVISRDLQDIYRLTGSWSETAPKDIVYQVFDSIDVLKHVECINPTNRQDRRFMLDRLSAGDKAIIGFADEKPVFYGWLMFGEIEMTYGVFEVIPEKTVFGYNLYTANSHRRRGVLTGFYRFIRHYLEQHDYQSLYVGISRDNSPSIKAHEKNGFIKKGRFYTLKLFGICFIIARFKYVRRFYIIMKCSTQSHCLLQI